jgi:peroxiredoxin
MSARAIAAVAVLCGAAACHKPGNGTDAFRPMQVGDTAPALAMTSLHGDSVHVPASDAPVLVNVWATWCTSCAEEMGDLAEIDKDFRGRGLKVVAVSVDNGDDARVTRFVGDQKLPFTVVHDPAGAIEEKYGVVAVPTTYLIAPGGKVVWEHAGNIGPVKEELRKAAAEVLPGSR